MLDIDYIFKWILMPNKRKYQFWIAPCTVIFENVHMIAFESDHTNLVIDSIVRDNPKEAKNAEFLEKKIEYDWLIETTLGEISFKSVGFNQYVRTDPVLIKSQKLDLVSRNGISFNTI